MNANHQGVWYRWPAALVLPATVRAWIKLRIQTHRIAASARLYLLVRFYFCYKIEFPINFLKNLISVVQRQPDLCPHMM